MASWRWSSLTMTTVVMTIVWLNQLSTGLAGPGVGTNVGQKGTLMSASNRLAAVEQQPPIKTTAMQAVSTSYHLGARTGLAEQELRACRGGVAWCSLQTWGSRMWQWLGGGQRGPMYRWQERGPEEHTHGPERDGRGSDGVARMRRLREATIPHIIHQVLTLAHSTGPGICIHFFKECCLHCWPLRDIEGAYCEGKVFMCTVQVFLDGEAALEEEERKEERAGKEFRRFNHR